MKILVCGGRNYRDRDFIFATLNTVHASYDGGVTCLIHGNAPGADSIADEWALAIGIDCVAYPADWVLHGRRAGPIRNAQMLAEEPDIQLVVAFPGGSGTEDMIRKATKRGIETLIHRTPEATS